MAPVALFVIDIQVGLAANAETQTPHAAVIREAGTAILERARKRIDQARSKGEEPPLTIVFVQHEEKPEEGFLVRGSELWELVFKPREGDNAERLVAKNTRTLLATSFFPTYRFWHGDSTEDTFESNPDLAEQLKKEGVERIIAFGIQSECCVRSTSKGALAAGLQVTLLKGAHTTYGGKTKSAKDIEREVEEELIAKGAEVVDWAEAKS
jgi:nicotinamidase-related amidase